MGSARTSGPATREEVGSGAQMGGAEGVGSDPGASDTADLALAMSLEPVPNFRRYAMDSFRLPTDVASTAPSERLFAAGCLGGGPGPISNRAVRPIVGTRL